MSNDEPPNQTDYSKIAKCFKPVAANEPENPPSYMREKFTKLHLAISKRDFNPDSHLINGREKEAFPNHLSMSKAIDIDVDKFMHYLHIVGEQYGWPFREEYSEQHHDKLQAFLNAAGSEFYVFEVDYKPAGFCFVSRIGSPQDYAGRFIPDHETGMSKSEAVQMFKHDGHLPNYYTVIEINKVGFSNDYTKKKLGKHFIPRMLQLLMEQGNDSIVYLNTRDTNHPKVIKFYKDLGFNVFATETLESDIAIQHQKIITPDDPEFSPPQ